MNYTSFNFANKLIYIIKDTPNKHRINKFTCQNITNIILNNLSKVGLTSRDLQGNKFTKAVTDLVNYILNSNKNKSGYNFNSQDISLMLNGLAQLVTNFMILKKAILCQIYWINLIAFKKTKFF